jgi:hypothetical protein
MRINKYSYTYIWNIFSEQEYFFENIKQYVPDCMKYKVRVLNKSDKLLENPEEDNQQPI